MWDPSRVRKRLGWSTEHSNLLEILGDAWRWHQARFMKSPSMKPPP